jgi:TusA-related sulfurtransferase/DNA-binding transcriptional ArsR family regulator
VETSVAALLPPDQRLPRRGGVSVARALGSSTRASIFAHIQDARGPLSVRDIAATFDLHPNVARTHLDTLADAGLVAVGRRKHPGGGRPAKVYRAREDASLDAEVAATEDPGTPAAATALVGLLAGLLDGGDGVALPRRAQDAARALGRRLVADVGARPALMQRSGSASADGTGLELAGHIAVRALRRLAPAARVVRAGDEWIDLAGVRGVFADLEAHRPDVADALERGLVEGTLAAAGVPVTLADAGATADGALTWRARAAGTARAGIGPAATVDARGRQRESGVVEAMRAVTTLARGDVLEVLAEGPGSPAAFARWADRAGHELLGVERIEDAGRVGIRLLIRKGS